MTNDPWNAATDPWTAATPPATPSAQGGGTGGGAWLPPTAAPTAAIGKGVRVFAASSLLIVAAAAGVLVGHATWTSPSSPQSAFPGFGFPSTPGSNPSTSGPKNSSAIEEQVDPAIVDISSTFKYQSTAGEGTGIVLTSNGEVLTNNHVINGATTVSVTDIGNGRTYSATVISYDRSKDLAVLQLQGASGLRTVSIGDSSTAKVGDKVLAIGN